MCTHAATERSSSPHKSCSSQICGHGTVKTVCSARCLVEEVRSGLTKLWVRAGSPQLLQPLEPSDQSKLTAACGHAHHVTENGTIDKAKRKSRGTRQPV